jgi:isopentenyl diphosphate isomerase/L-lactate dehydrogenase-like FMN-dependent dehydrogenase
MAGRFLKAAVISPEKTIDRVKLTKRQIQVAMFAAGAGDLNALRNVTLRET